MRLWVLTIVGMEGVLTPFTYGFVDWDLDRAITVRLWVLIMLGKLTTCYIREDAEPHG